MAAKGPRLDGLESKRVRVRDRFDGMEIRRLQQKVKDH